MNKRAVTNSTTGYCHEIGLRQERQRPRKRIKLTTGILSYQWIFFLHRGQEEAGEMTEPPLFQRIRQTFKKLPTQAPKSNERGVIRTWIESPQETVWIK